METEYEFDRDAIIVQDQTKENMLAVDRNYVYYFDQKQQKWRQISDNFPFIKSEDKSGIGLHCQDSWIIMGTTYPDEIKYTCITNSVEDKINWISFTDIHVHGSGFNGMVYNGLCEFNDLNHIDYIMHNWTRKLLRNTVASGNPVMNLIKTHFKMDELLILFGGNETENTLSVYSLQLNQQTNIIKPKLEFMSNDLLSKFNMEDPSVICLHDPKCGLFMLDFDPIDANQDELSIRYQYMNIYKQNGKTIVDINENKKQRKEPIYNIERISKHYKTFI